MNYLQEKAKLIMALRGQGIMSSEVLSAMEKIPREDFLPRALRAHSYENASLPIANGQTISQPYVVARMTEALQLTRKHRVLEIGTGSGYQACVLALLSRRVYTVERLRPLLVGAETRFRLLQLSNVTSLLGDGARGWPEAAPFDRIMVTCQMENLAPALCDQLKEGGILIAPVGPSGQEQLIRVTRKGAQFSEEELMPVRFVPMLTGVAER